MEELRRRMASAKSWGIEPARLVTPAEIYELVPYIDETIVLGGFHMPERRGRRLAPRGHAHARACGRRRARSRCSRTRRSRALDVEGGRIRRVHTSRGAIEAETVVIACGVWSPLLARMAGAHIPLTPMVHQMIDIGPVPRFEQSSSAIEFPIVRDMDVFMYERQDGTGLEIGSYAHRSIVHDPEEIPSLEAAALSPTEFPFTQADFDPQLADALDLMPEIVGDESVGVKYAINGLISLTPDGMPILGETPEVKGLWSAAAVWVKEGPGVGKSRRRMDGAGRVAHRPPLVGRRPLPRPPEDPRARRRRGRRRRSRRRTGSSIPRSSGRPTGTCAARRCTSGSGSSAPCSTRRPAGSARTGTRRTRRSSSATASSRARPNGTRAGGRRSSMPSTSRCASTRGSSTSPRSRSSTSSGAGALDALQRSVLAQMDVAVGRVVYTPVLSPGGGFRSDLTIMRLGDEEFRIVTGGAHGMADRKLFSDQLPDDGSASLVDVTTAWTTIGLWGPRARDILAERHLGRRVARGVRLRHAAGRSRSARSSCSRRGSRTSATSAGSSTSRSSRARASGTRCGKRAARTASPRAGSASTARPAGSRSATARSPPSWRASTPSSRRGCRGRP